MKNKIQRKLHQLIRPIRFFFQRMIRGFDDSETWSLDATIAKFTLPRLRRFKQVTIAHPDNLSMEEWQKILDEIEWYLDMVTKNYMIDPSEEERLEKAHKLWADYFSALWW